MINSVYPQQSQFYPSAVVSQPVRPQQNVYPAQDIDLSAPPMPNRSKRLTLGNWLFHPLESYQLSRKLGVNPQSEESFGIRLAMYQALKKNLTRKERRYLFQQLMRGRLTDTRADDNRSTLAHLYSIVTTPRGSGFHANVVLGETLRVMTEPKTITQKFGDLSAQSLQNLMNYYNSGLGPKMSEPLDVNALRVVSSATCVASSLMYYMADKNPSEFTRHIAGLTGPRQAFYEKVSASELSPDNPALAGQKLNEYGVPATAVPGTNGAQYWVKVDLPYSGAIRAIDQQNTHEPGSRGVVEAAYQGALTHLVVRSYDPGLDMRVNPDGSLDPSKGLEEDRKTLMESIIKDNGGVMSVTYQFTAAGQDDSPYLIGYYRNFDQTTRDIMQALDMGEYVIIGITDTDPAGTAGRINMGHELTVVGYERDKRTGEILFKIADSDDDNPKLVKRRASEIVPKIHHAGFPVKLAQQIWSQINANTNNQYLVPGTDDAMRYQLIATVPPSQQGAFLEDYFRRVQADEAAQAPEQQPGATYPQQANPAPFQLPPSYPISYSTYPGSYSYAQSYFRPVQPVPFYSYPYVPGGYPGYAYGNYRRAAPPL